MRFIKTILPTACLAFSACTTMQNTTPHVEQPFKPRTVSPVSEHGALSVEGVHIHNEKGEITSLAGPSFFWSNTGWGQERFYTAGAVETFAKDWNASIIRAAMGADNDGSYLKDKRANALRVQTVVDAAIANGLYVIVDWHSHEAKKKHRGSRGVFHNPS